MVIRENKKGNAVKNLALAAMMWILVLIGFSVMPPMVAANENGTMEQTSDILMPPIEHEPSVYVGDGKVFAFGVDIIQGDSVLNSGPGVEIDLEETGDSGRILELTEDVIKSTMNSSYQRPSIIMRNGHMFAFSVKVTAQLGAIVYAGKGTEVAALSGSTVHAMRGSIVHANKHSTVKAEAGSRVHALQASTVTAGRGSYVVSDFDSTVTAENGSVVRARYGGLVKAASGSLIYSEPGSLVEPADGARVVPSEVSPFDENPID